MLLVIEESFFYQTSSYDNSRHMKKTPVFTKADGIVHQAEDIAHFLAGHIFHLRRQAEEQKLTDWIKGGESNKLLFTEITAKKEVQKNLAEFENTEVKSALSRCLGKIRKHIQK